LISLCPKLDTLDLSCSDLNVYMDAEMLLFIAENCLNLKRVNLSSCLNDNIEDAAFVDFIRRYDQLKELNLDWNTKFKGTAFTANLPAYLRVLDICSFPHLTPEALQDIAQRSPQLESLKIGWEYPNINIRHWNEALSQLTNLRKIDVFNLNINVDTEEKLTSLGKLYNLIEISLHGFNYIDDSVIKAISRGCPLVERLRIHNCKISDEALRSIASLSLLKVLDIFGQELTVETLKAVVEGAPKLEEVSLRRVELSNFSPLAKLQLLTKLDTDGNISPAVLLEIASHGRLESLSLWGNKIDEQTIITVIERCKNLKQLNSFRTTYSNEFVVALNAEMELRHGNREPMEEEILAGRRFKILVWKSHWKKVSVPVNPWVVIKKF